MTTVVQPSATPVSVPVVEVYLTERLDLACVASVQAALANAVRLCPDRLVVDLSRCAGIDAAGVALLLDVHRQMLRAGACLTLRSPSPRLQRILRIARVEHVLHVVPAEAPPSRPLVDRVGTAP